MPLFKIGSKVRRKADDLVQTIYDLDDRTRTIKCNWVDDGHIMHYEMHALPMTASEPCTIELVEETRRGKKT